MELQDNHSIVEDKCNKYMSYCEKLKDERENYKEAWESTQKKLD